MGVCNCSMFCCTFLYVHSSFAIFLMGKREVDALLSLSSWCLAIVVWLILAVPWVCLQFAIVVFREHTCTHLPFLCMPAAESLASVHISEGFPYPFLVDNVLVPKGCTLIFSYIHRLGSFFGVQNFEFQYFHWFSEK